MAESFWLDEPAPPPASGAVVRRPDVVVVGAGVTGCSCALALARAGLRVRVHEARQVASGASGRNGGFALRGTAGPYDQARLALGPEVAAALWRLSERALDRMEVLAGDALARTGSLRLAVDETERAELVAEYEALGQDGFAADWLDRPEGPLEGRFCAGLLHPRDGALQPARWVRRLAGLAALEGVEIREGSRIEALGDLDVDHVVVATDGYTRGLVPSLDAAVAPTRGQVIATEPLPERLFERPHYARHGYDYWQQTPDRRLVIGGWRDTSFATEETYEEATTPDIQGAIDGFVRELLGFAPRVTHRWAGIFGVTADRLPLVGPVPAEHAGRAGVWAACGYSGHGNVLGFACGELVADAILGRPAAELAALDPVRLL
jgi:glycine/D-amino acid oxidase-like deaminating enzyme